VRTSHPDDNVYTSSTPRDSLPDRRSAYEATEVRRRKQLSQLIATRQRVERFKQVRQLAHKHIAEGRGYQSRHEGAFAVPVGDMEEPARTERLLARPFTVCHSHPADAFHARVGFLFFRVNGLTYVGVAYRLIL
jgi:hypothetical protein